MFSFLSNLKDPVYLATILLRFPCVLLALSVHESAHGLAAEKLGDPTARCTGRISLNPLRHFDVFGTICMILLGFGWAKPVPINPHNFKNEKTGMALTAAAGPASNVGMALIGALLYQILLKIYALCGWVTSIGGTIYLSSSQPALLQNFTNYSLMLFQIFCLLNVSLAIFNLIPVPPLDGSRILLLFLPQKYYFKLMQYERYIMVVMMVLLFSGFLDTPLRFLTSGAYNGLMWLVSRIPFLAL